MRVLVPVYRDAISALVDAYASLRSVANERERCSEAERCRRLADELQSMFCARAQPRDLDRAARLLFLIADDPRMGGQSSEK